MSCFLLQSIGGHRAAVLWRPHLLIPIRPHGELGNFSPCVLRWRQRLLVSLEFDSLGPISPMHLALVRLVRLG